MSATKEPSNDDRFKPLKVSDPDPALLRRMNHREWLDTFSVSLQIGRDRRRAPVTPFLEGAVTRLHYAALYIQLLQTDLHWLARDNKLLRKHIEHLGAVAAPPFRPQAEADHDPTSDEGAKE